MATNREQFADILASMKEDEHAAMLELANLFGSNEMAEIIIKIENIHSRTIPYEGYDQIVSSALQSLNSLKNLTSGFLNNEESN